MLSGLRALLPPDAGFEGIASAPTPPDRPLPDIQYFVGGHPIPNAESWKAAEAILSLLANAMKRRSYFFAVWRRIGALGTAPRFRYDAGRCAAVLSHVGDLRCADCGYERGAKNMFRQ